MTEAPETGAAEEVEPGVRRVLAPNPSPMTHWGTNTYIIGTGTVAVVDPGPADPAHLAALEASLGGARVSHIVVTHAHVDHTALVPELARRTGAEVVAFGASEHGRREVMQRLADEGLVGGGEGVDAAFVPDTRVAHGDVIAGEGFRIEAIHTPGHMAGHLALAVGDAVLTGDHVMGWASTLISPPDGDLGAFMGSCALLKEVGARVFYPGHGASVTDPNDRLDWLISHRRARENAILTALGEGAGTAEDIAARVYTDVPPALMRGAVRNTLAHLVHLCETNRATASPRISANADFSLTTG